MKNIKTFLLSPLKYVLLYVFLIFVFAIIYYHIPEFFKTTLPNSFLTSLYFSTITITTVGYGDMSPVGNWAQICVMLESISGIFIAGFFLNEIAQDHSRKITEREKEKNKKEVFKNDIAKLLRYDKLIQLDILFYFEYTYIVTTPFARRTIDGVLDRNFTFNDLSDLYQFSSRFSDSLIEPAVKYFFIHQTNLILDIKNLLQNVELNNFNDLENLIIKFLEKNKELDNSDAILSQTHIKLREGQSPDFKMASDEYSKWIAGYKKDLKVEGANMMNQFIALYDLIKSNLLFIDAYQIKIAEINTLLNKMG